MAEDGWETFEDARRRVLTAGLAVTPARRLEVLEEMIQLAFKTGALPRPGGTQRSTEPAR